MLNIAQHFSDTSSWWFVSPHFQASPRGYFRDLFHSGEHPQFPAPIRVIPGWSPLNLRQGAVLAELKAACPSSNEFIRAFANGSEHEPTAGLLTMRGCTDEDL